MKANWSLDVPFAISATMACDVPQKFDGALSLAITPKSAIGPYDENPNTAPRVNIQSWVKEKTGIYSYLKRTDV